MPNNRLQSIYTSLKPRPKKVVLFPEIGRVNFFLLLTHPRSRNFIRIHIFCFKKKGKKKKHRHTYKQKGKETEKNYLVVNFETSMMATTLVP